jgi:phosphatidylinositol 3-kinase
MDCIEETYVEDSSTPFKSIVDSVSKLGSTLRKTEKYEQTSGELKAKRSKERSMLDVLTEQDAFFSGVLNIQQRCRDSRGKKDAKEAELKSLLLKEGYDRNESRDAVPLPSRPELFVNGVNPESATMFKSALYPALLEFHVDGVMKTSAHGQSIISGGKSEKSTRLHDEARYRSYKVIVKTGDDLRQDQLVVMMLQLMDGLLKRAALDLCLTPYSILAMSTSSGFVEFVEGAIPISQILSKYNGSILHFFQTVAFQKGAKYDIRPDVISNYVRSCAGYCVITYILGVGDRHLDNILLLASGHFFHIDFGFIFGRDPKPLPPAFRLTREVSVFD